MANGEVHIQQKYDQMESYSIRPPVSADVLVCQRPERCCVRELSERLHRTATRGGSAENAVLGLSGPTTRQEAAAVCTLIETLATEISTQGVCHAA
jgi:hypothetical protein